MTVCAAAASVEVAVYPLDVGQEPTDNAAVTGTFCHESSLRALVAPSLYTKAVSPVVGAVIHVVRALRELRLVGGIVTAIGDNPLKVPLVIRLTGTNEEIAVKILEEHGLSAMTDMDEAVRKAVALATGGKAA